MYPYIHCPVANTIRYRQYMQRRIVSLVIILIMMFALTSCNEGNSGPVVILGEIGWTYSSGDFNTFNSIQQTSDGGYIATGSTAPHNEPNHLWLVKIDSTGGKEWDKTFSISVDDYSEGHSVWQTNDGGYIIVGYTALPEIDDVGAWLIKTDSEGTKQWDRIFSASRYDSFEFGQQTNDGGNIIVGRTHPSGDDNRDAWLVRTDFEGNTIWSKTYGGQATDSGNYVQQTLDGGYIIGGVTESYGAGSDDIWLIKTDSEGNRQWDRTFGRREWEVCRSVLQSSDGGYIILGETWVPEKRDADAWLIKTDSEGNRLWDKTFGEEDSTNHGSSIQQTSDGGYIIVGSSYEANLWLIKTDLNGEKEWERGYDSGSIHFITQTSDGGYVMSGITRPNIEDVLPGLTQSPIVYEALIIKTNSQGFPEN